MANIPPGPAIVTAVVTATGETIGSRAVFIQGGAVTYADSLGPDPDAQ